ncbi:hypothetical protein SDJN03_02356, partial [Cucurbita argyrosperma subsp. sororia]
MPALAYCVEAAAAPPPGCAFAGDSSLPSPVLFSGGPPETTIFTSPAATPISENPSWSPSLSSSLYKIDGWGAPYFSVNGTGNMTVRPYGTATLPHQEIDLLKIVKKASDPISSGGLGLQLPLIVRFPDVLKNRLESLQSAFDCA